ncbi:hypothetical protein BDZ90DRAFT_134082 [Jaminaea rosea]|uniref:Zinc finger PHD-type domain-containing protein n=1 Tax=Jaminaea rosea TaxID=1569628 RepID=A0A316UV67_9BASI|nr:hypothetical protein BDZ90DRAFT_134082 [Jaminaea rosea]PWN28904.1 hypothetical protein BDZ90DRAFT_134082 [Jaminaea rosea]
MMRTRSCTAFAGHYEERLMIACDLCDEWYHAACVPSMDDELAALVDVFVCPRCEPHTTECTTMKPPCLRQGCKMAARPPLSRYCSDRCGILVAAARIAKTKYAKSSSGGPKRLLTKQVQAASRKEGMVVWGEADAEGLQQWFASLSVRGADHGQEEVEDEDESKPIHPTSEPLSVGSSREEERLVDLRHHLSKLTAQRQEVSTTLDLAESRVKLLQLVDDRLGVLPPVMVEETASSSSSKKSKSKGGSKKDDAGAGLKTQPRCGYDERLAWDDERFSAWMASREGREMLAGSKKLDGHLVDADGQAVVLEDGGGADISSASATVAKVCGTAKRRCKRHADWNAVKTDDFEVEKDSQVRNTMDGDSDGSARSAGIVDRAILPTLSYHRLRSCPRSQRRFLVRTHSFLTSKASSKQSDRLMRRGPLAA